MKVNEIDGPPLGVCTTDRSVRPIEPTLIRILFAVSDVFFLILFFNLGFLLRFGEWEPHALLTFQMIYVVLIMLGSLYAFDAFDPRSQISGLHSPLRFGLATLFAGALIALTTYAMGGALNNQFGRGVMGLALVPFAVVGGLSRWFANEWLKKRDAFLNWLVIGTSEYLEQFSADVKKKRRFGRVHFLLPDSEHASASFAVDGMWGQLAGFLERRWSGIIVCTGDRLPNHVVDQLLKARLAGVKVYNLSDFYEGIWLKVPVYFVDRSWILLNQGFALLHNPIGLRIKRILDVMASILLLPLCLPFVGFGALLVFLQDFHSPFFAQKRIGLEGREFLIFKLRTMIPNAGDQWSQENDDRITAIGRILRKFRIDELPQIWNVLIGDMSFIGPRPELPAYRQDLEEQLPHYGLRHIVRPGITGWAQVLYKYGSTVEDAREKLQYDLYYIKNYSLILDVAILFKTVRVLFLGEGR